MVFSFGSQKNDPIYGSYGEFTVGQGSNQVRAQFLLSKMKPGLEGNWENLLASQMVPWREVFKIEELTFDELLQRDLDDSRVAHDLIPYLLGNNDSSAKFFPPILAVLVPKSPQKSGINSYYPRPDYSENSIAFGDLFDFEKVKFENQITPLGVIKYNRQKISFVIVDGQHRAMAVLALHRQLNSSWGADRFASFYNHLSITPEQVNHIELPVCIIFFPDLYAENEVLTNKGVDLKKVCREIFLVVNKTAKKVSQSRELLLDDEDLAARMMRSTLSKLKDRGEDESSVSRIYSFAFGDADADLGKQVVAGQLEYSSAVALHKMHAAACFGIPDAFKFDQPSDITDGRRTKNSDRPAHIIIGTPLQHWNTLYRWSGKYHPPQEVDQAIGYLGNISDSALLPLFDQFRPFCVHNETLRELRTRLLDPDARADLVQSKCYSLLFEGSGVRYVFEQHRNTLKKRSDEALEEGRNPSDYIKNQLRDADAILSALDRYESQIRAKRACKFFNIDYDKFFSSEGNEEQRKELLARAKTIFDTVSTQAFQLGFLMAVLTVVEDLVEVGTAYDTRLQLIRFISHLYLKALNAYFSSGSSAHRTFTGLITDSRSKVFDQNQLGLRGLLSMSVRELNERQWVFFRYLVLEIVHCKYCYQTMKDTLSSTSDPAVVQLYKRYVPELLDHILRLREQYIEAAVQSALKTSEFTMELQILKATLTGEGRYDSEIEAALEEKAATKRQEVRDKCKQNIYASLGEFTTASKISNRLLTENPSNADESGGD